MYAPDRNILAAVKRYDRELSIKWNPFKEWFELWRLPLFRAPQLITPITKSIYDVDHPREFVSLDQRLLWWVRHADSWSYGGHRRQWAESHKKEEEFNQKLQEGRKRQNKDVAKDMWHGVSNFFYKRHKPKVQKPSFNNHKPVNKWIRPDLKGATTKRMYARSNANAKAYNFQK